MWKQNHFFTVKQQIYGVYDTFRKLIENIVKWYIMYQNLSRTRRGRQS